MTRYDFHGLSHVGLVRSNNEDIVVHDAAQGIGLLADGMGGYRAGEVASAMAVDIVREHCGRWLDAAGSAGCTRAAISEAMRTAVELANRAIFEASRSRPEQRGMGTTLVFGVFRPDRVVIGHVGDSRCYRWRDGRLDRLTRDHSVLQEHLDAGFIRPDQAPSSPYRHLVTRALGIEAEVDMEVFTGVPRPEDVYLACSDGLTDMVSDPWIASVLAAGLPIDGTASALIDGAIAAGGRDNVSVLLVRAKQVAAG